jgi:hypothetical protein
VAQGLPNEATIGLRGLTMTLSFWIKFDSASIASMGDFTAKIGEKTTTADDTFLTTNYADASTSVTITNGSLPTTWTKYTVTRTISAASNNLSVEFSFANSVSNTFGYNLAQVQLEQGTKATSFEILPMPLIMKQCLYYYETIVSSGTAFSPRLVSGLFYTGTAFSGPLSYEYKRINPTVAAHSTLVFLTTSQNNVAFSSVSFNNPTRRGVSMVGTASPSISAGAAVVAGQTASNGVILIDISAEL